MEPTTPLANLLQHALEEFREALVSRNVYTRNHANLNRAHNGGAQMEPRTSGPTSSRGSKGK